MAEVLSRTSIIKPNQNTYTYKKTNGVGQSYMIRNSADKRGKFTPISVQYTRRKFTVRQLKGHMYLTILPFFVKRGNTHRFFSTKYDHIYMFHVKSRVCELQINT